jgi:hypothetical protein
MAFPFVWVLGYSMYDGVGDEVVAIGVSWRLHMGTE